jgi:hypothetical protein
MYQNDNPVQFLVLAPILVAVQVLVDCPFAVVEVGTMIDDPAKVGAELVERL